MAHLRTHTQIGVSVTHACRYTTYHMENLVKHISDKSGVYLPLLHEHTIFTMYVYPFNTHFSNEYNKRIAFCEFFVVIVVVVLFCSRESAFYPSSASSLLLAFRLVSSIHISSFHSKLRKLYLFHIH